MNEQEQIEMMRRCSSEIKQLRAQIDHLQPKADAYDNIAKLLGLLPVASRGYGEDLAWMLDKGIAEIEKAAAARKAREAREAAIREAVKPATTA
ncbi:MAG: hypothetical protein KIS96_14425 [Bauldia sp.]|nr:hypothetical protein [Bauldia sp.]